MTTPIDPVERRLPEALTDLAGPRTPDYFIDILGQTARVRQRPAWARPGRWFGMNGFLGRPALVAVVVVLVAVVGGGIILSQRNQSAVGAPQSSPSAPATAAPSAPANSGTPLPADLAVVWQGPPREIPQLLSSTRTRLNFDPSSFWLTGDAYGGRNFESTAAVTGPGTLELVSDITIGCNTGDVGDYHWSLSPKGKILTISADHDACAARAVAVSGTWYTSTACKVDPGGCLGDLEAGTFPTQYIDPQLDPGSTWQPAFGAITYTVPDGWSNSSDWPQTFSLTPSSDYANETKDGTVPGATHQVTVFADPAAMGPSCDDVVLTNVPRTVDGLMAHLTGSKSLTTSPVHTVTIGGRSAKWVDIALAPTWTAKCAGDRKPSASLLVQTDDPKNGWGFGLGDKERARIVLVDLGSGHTSLIVVDSSDPARFDQLATDAMPIIESFNFR
jgi:hypothetical protein